MKRYRCSACRWATDDQAAAREHFEGKEHHARTYLMDDKGRVDDLLDLREELQHEEDGPVVDAGRR